MGVVTPHLLRLTVVFIGSGRSALPLRFLPPLWQAGGGGGGGGGGGEERVRAVYHPRIYLTAAATHCIVLLLNLVWVTDVPTFNLRLALRKKESTYPPPRKAVEVDDDVDFDVDIAANTQRNERLPSSVSSRPSRLSQSKSRYSSPNQPAAPTNNIRPANEPFSQIKSHRPAAHAPRVPSPFDFPPFFLQNKSNPELIISRIMSKPPHQKWFPLESNPAVSISSGGSVAVS